MFRLVCCGLNKCSDSRRVPRVELLVHMPIIIGLKANFSHFYNLSGTAINEKENSYILSRRIFFRIGFIYRSSSHGCCSIVFVLIEICILFTLLVYNKSRNQVTVSSLKSDSPRELFASTYKCI